MKQLINEMADLAARGEHFALATVITRNGSAPRSAGAKMLVRKDGSTAGTVGGGILEAKVEQAAREILTTHERVVQGFQFSGKDAATMEAICGGQVEVLVEWMDAGDEQLCTILQELKAAMAEHRKTWLLTALPSPGSQHSLRSACHSLVHADGRVSGSLPVEILPEIVVETRDLVVMQAGPLQLVVEPLDIAGTVYIFGAGHVSRSLAEFTKAVGFWTVVLDDRPEYANAQRFPSADRLVVLDSFEDALGSIQVERDSFIVIVTRGHLNDRVVLAQALKSQAGYIGMIGSRRKTALVFDELRKAGFTDEDLARVRAPIGLPIAAETPEEIGISIVAEMIQARAKLK